MRTAKVVESVDIEAPRPEVFEIVTSKLRRLQLSPLWGVAEVQDMSSDFPQEGSSYHSRLIDGGDEPEYDTIVTAFESPHKFSYRLTTKREPQVTWTFQVVPGGTRLMYREEFLVDEAGDAEFVQSVRNIVEEWLSNLKRYAELRGGWWRPVVRRGADRFLLPLKVSQRRVILLLLAWEAIGCISFLALGLGWGTAKLLGWV